ncbi:hypothetical protein GGF46_000433 [Coemansia sp. RSA 552]|nr:hypothetical protein GGF46_000433 [Coemansia sp. RSA 552]
MATVETPSAERKAEIARGLADVREAVRRGQRQGGVADVCLVAVSKRKPPSDILAAYEAGQRHFGENYVQELCDKAPVLPADIKWHFIGRLQSNKCKALAAIPNLWAVETIDSADKARKLSAAWAATGGPDPLGVFIQVNTSGEENKGGVHRANVPEVAREIAETCPGLCLKGLMTIGSIEGSDQRPNPEFQALVALRDELRASAGVDLALSMGMSSDFEHALELGAASVRVGTRIFGARPPLPANVA